jgi:hypothetical protein
MLFSLFCNKQQNKNKTETKTKKIKKEVNISSFYKKKIKDKGSAHRRAWKSSVRGRSVSVEWGHVYERSRE